MKAKIVISAKVVELIIKLLSTEAPVREKKDVSLNKVRSKTRKKKKKRKKNSWYTHLDDDIYNLLQVAFQCLQKFFVNFFLFWKLTVVYTDCSDNLDFLTNVKTTVSNILVCSYFQSRFRVFRPLQFKFSHQF